MNAWASLNTAGLENWLVLRNTRPDPSQFKQSNDATNKSGEPARRPSHQPPIHCDLTGAAAECKRHDPAEAHQCVGQTAGPPHPRRRLFDAHDHDHAGQSRRQSQGFRRLLLPLTDLQIT